ncbi:MAG TPA: DUF938 domain-containing protein [Sphingomicrobium sp.]|nr:DUF938 domain-containing protein [Sphingomicrobium sp.]
MKLRSPSVARNTGPIGDVLAEWLPASGLVLEIASGSGEHALAFAKRFPRLEWQPSDPDAQARASIAEWRKAEGAANLFEPLAIDVCNSPWPVERADAVVSINMAHISRWEASLGLIDGAARVLATGGALILYGPWVVEGIETAPSNLAFDADLKARDPRWGLRQVADFADAASENGFALDDQRAMPANNRMLLFRRT